MLEAALSTNYFGVVPTKNNLGCLTFGSGSNLFTVGFDNTAQSNAPGAILRFDSRTNEPQPLSGQAGALFVPPDANMVRPIGILCTRLPRN